MVFRQLNRKWQFIQEVPVYGVRTDSSVAFIDLNFDGCKDLACHWYFSSGRCNCSGKGCVSIYLYDARAKKVIEAGILRHLEYAIVSNQKAFYFGEHCEGRWSKCQWEGSELKEVETFQFNPGDSFYTDTACIRTHEKIIHGKRKIISKKRTCQLPKSWINLFKED